MSDSNDFIVISSVWREICVWAVTLNDKWQAHAQCEKCAAASPLLTYQNLSTKKIEKRIGRALQKMPISRLLISRLCVNFRFCVDAAAVAAAPPSTNDDFSSSAPLFLFLFVLDFFCCCCIFILVFKLYFYDNDGVYNEWMQGCGMCVWAVSARRFGCKQFFTTDNNKIIGVDGDSNQRLRHHKTQSGCESHKAIWNVRGAERCAWNRCWRLVATTKTETLWYREALRTYTFTWWPAFRISSTARFYSSFFSAFSLFRSRMLSCPCSKFSHTTFRCQ